MKNGNMQQVIDFFYLAGVSIENGWDGYAALVLQKNKHGENYMILLNYHMQN